MEKEFIEYEQALALKELGFDEPCFAFYDESLYFPNNENQYGTFCNQKLDVSSCSSPTFSQAFRWFREKYNLRGFIGFRPNVKQFDCHVYDMSLSGKEYVKQRTMEEFNKDPKVGTYEEAELECLKKLIEIVKKQKEDESNIIV
jgi:hypothetical protein